MKARVRRGALAAVAFALSLASALPSTAAPEESGQAAFARATALEATGDFEKAREALLALARERPDDPFADDALFEAALLSEERLADPERARTLYAELVARHPESRLRRRAEGRVAFLTRSLGSGAEAYVEYQAILAGHARRAPAESIARMEQLLAAHPDFVLADRALYWVAGLLAQEGRAAEAEARYREVEQRFPATEWAARARHARGDLALQAGRLGEARRIFTALAGSSDPLARSLGEEGLAAAASRLKRRVLYVASLVWLGLFLVTLGVLARRRLALTTATLYYVPVAALFVAAAASEHRQIAWATTIIAAGGLVVVWLTSSFLRRPPGAPPASRRAALLLLPALLATTLALGYTAVHTLALDDLVLETLTHGPDR